MFSKFRFYNDALNAACGTPGEWRASVLEVFTIIITVITTTTVTITFTISPGTVCHAGVSERVRTFLHHPRLVQLAHLDLLQAQGQICQG